MKQASWTGFELETRTQGQCLKRASLYRLRRSIIGFVRGCLSKQALSASATAAQECGAGQSQTAQEGVDAGFRHSGQ
jgi:hypothetical protein